MRPRQDSVIERLERQMISSVRTAEIRSTASAKRVWTETKQRLKQIISEIYRRSVGRGSWDLTSAARSGALREMDNAVGTLLESFHAMSIKVISQDLRTIYRESVLRQAWILDQVTPPSIKVKLPRSSILFHESSTTFRGPEDDTAWKVRWSAWMDAYRSALNQNLRLGAMNQSTVDDATDEVDATRPGSPQSDFWKALERILTHQQQSTLVMASSDVVNANDDLELTEIWQTRYYDRVCDECDANRDLTREEADGDIPFHPFCGCYWRVVPASWADLLKSGDADDQALALQMERDNIVPSTMIVRNDAGTMVGSVVVDFDKWVAGLGERIYAQ